MGILGSVVGELCVAQGTSALGRPGWGRDCFPGGELTQRPCNPCRPCGASRDPVLAPRSWGRESSAIGGEREGAAALPWSRELQAGSRPASSLRVSRALCSPSPPGEPGASSVAFLGKLLSGLFNLSAYFLGLVPSQWWSFED